MARLLGHAPGRAIRAGTTYARRLALWWKVPFELRFVKSPSGSNSLRKSWLYSPLSSLQGLAEFRNMLLLEDATVEAKGVGLFNIRARTDDLYVCLPSSEPAVFDFVRSNLKPGDVFVDAGANIGIYTILASRIVGDQGRVVSIEMMPETFGRLRMHVELNRCGNVTLVNKAVSDRSGRRMKVAMPADGRHGKASIVAETDAHPESVAQVETQTLDDMLSGCGKVRLIKMDLEGAEALAVQGATEVLERTELLVFERWGSQHDVSALLEERGFRVRPLDSRNAVAERAA